MVYNTYDTRWYVQYVRRRDSEGYRINQFWFLYSKESNDKHVNQQIRESSSIKLQIPFLDVGIE